MLMRIHEGHSGIEMSKERARPHIFWPGISKQIEELVSECSTCQKFRKQQQRLPLQSHVIPEQPFEKVGADLFHYGKQNYLLVVDYTSKFFEVCLLRDTTSYSVVQQIKKSIFARHGIPVQLITDNRPQFSAAEFRRFMADWQIIHDTSSPLYPRSNGLAMRTVQKVKSILKKAQHSGEDPYLSILNFWTTRKPDQPSPAEILMGRKLCTLLLTVIKPKEKVNKHLVAERLKKQAQYYNVHTREQTTLQPDATVRYRDHRSRTWEPARVLDQVGPRTYNIQTKSGVLRRNRQDILQSREPPHDLTPDAVETTPRQPQIRTSEPGDGEVLPSTRDEVAANPPSQYTTRSGRPVVKPLRYRQ
ncbi:Pol polyprotein [Elysia marginata]|uniref:Pol polyprotein n=1 Tax=Elysia marginata TaxID=1093978 RepID=A0AAV4HLZ6_9GAST|nr:Pol polyprotein [Elysia marginata]